MDNMLARCLSLFIALCLFIDVYIKSNPVHYSSSSVAVEQLE